MKIAVTGAGGGLGRAFMDVAGAEHELHPFTHQQLDVSSAEAVEEAFGPLKPEVVMHFAAMTGVDACEEEPQRAAEANVLGTFNVAMSARRAGAALVAISTDYVFDGEQEAAYNEEARPNPLSTYAWTKYVGERAAQAVLPDALIVRTAWVYGAGDDFFSKAVGWLAEGKEVGGIVDQFGTPTHVAHLAERLLPLVHSGIGGVVHLAGPEAVSWHAALARAVRLGDLSGTLVEKKADELARPAPRPANSALTSTRLAATGMTPMPPLDEGIRKVLSDVLD